MKITESDYKRVAALLEVETAVVKAVAEVESGGRGGFLSDGRPVILFEGHIFWQQLKHRNMDPQIYMSGNEDIVYPNGPGGITSEELPNTGVWNGLCVSSRKQLGRRLPGACSR